MGGLCSSARPHCGPEGMEVVALSLGTWWPQELEVQPMGTLSPGPCCHPWLWRGAGRGGGDSGDSGDTVPQCPRC